MDFINRLDIRQYTANAFVLDGRISTTEEIEREYLKDYFNEMIFFDFEKMNVQMPSVSTHLWVDFLVKGFLTICDMYAEVENKEDEVMDLVLMYDNAKTLQEIAKECKVELDSSLLLSSKWVCHWGGICRDARSGILLLSEKMIEMEMNATDLD